MPYAYQCCAFGVCENVYKISNPWSKGDNSTAEDLHKKDAGVFQVQDERDLEDFLLDFEEDLRALHPVRCSPSPGEKGVPTASGAVPTLNSEAVSDIQLHLQAKSVPS